ncbi:NmrA family NAD(P)-binding protein [Actinokineospora auranticolor]|uniref:Uncharacterized protein YbjT (DUF2867 family) n=1 Tax=Actinokineospora auranticolor TaxID=155976 RepID=A0A2S6GBJ8_9PSEU|nr:NmrA family NAD(P)-binding protein [Actinokineospora auranticolor]PPK61465.1 uncharacterized protein YbjT (DUF2867 family) [Actinokineospora auranticolor]
MTDPILVTGATGRQGGATARRLLADGRPVRALVRDTTTAAAVALATAGAELVTGDFDDPTSLRPAFDGVAAVFAVPTAPFGPNGPADETEAARGRALVDAAVAAGVEQVVLSTVASMSRSEQSAKGKAEIERYLVDRVARPTVLRPVRFVTNYLLTGDLGLEGIVDGVHRHFFPPHEPMQVITLEDIADFAALAFADPERYAGRTLELAGDQPTPVEAAAAIAAATGSPVRYEQVTTGVHPMIIETGRRWAAGERWHADIEALRVIHPGLRAFGTWLAESGAEASRARRARPRRPACQRIRLRRARPLGRTVHYPRKAG